jgi:hypothetical protein
MWVPMAITVTCSKQRLVNKAGPKVKNVKLVGPHESMNPQQNGYQDKMLQVCWQPTSLSRHM